MMPLNNAPEFNTEAPLAAGSRTADAVVSIVNNFVKWAGLVAIAYFAFHAIETLAGQRTTADIGVNFLADLKLGCALAGGLGLSGVAYGLGQRRLRRDTIARLQDRNRALEARIDPERSGSALTRRGETRPEDRV